MIYRKNQFARHKRLNDIPDIDNPFGKLDLKLSQIEFVMVSGKQNESATFNTFLLRLGHQIKY